jgi:hypothetical protein
MKNKQAMIAIEMTVFRVDSDPAWTSSISFFLFVMLEPQ